VPEYPSGNGDVVEFFEFLSGQYADSVPGKFVADPGADLAADTFIPADLNGRNGNAVFISGDSLNAVHRAEGDTYPAAGAVVLIHYSHKLRPLLLPAGITCQLRNLLVVFVWFCCLYCHDSSGRDRQN